MDEDKHVTPGEATAQFTLARAEAVKERLFGEIPMLDTADTRNLMDLAAKNLAAAEINGHGETVSSFEKVARDALRKLKAIKSVKSLARTSAG